MPRITFGHSAVGHWYNLSLTDLKTGLWTCRFAEAEG